MYQISRHILIPFIPLFAGNGDTAVVLAVVLLGSITIAAIILGFWKTLKGGKHAGTTSSGHSNHDSKYFIYNGNNLLISDADIKSILERRFSYYNALSPELKLLFEKRIRRFMSLKTFIIPGKETYKEVPVLLSATAVQLTFGLKEFELPWYQYIQVHAEEYFADDPHTLRVLAGHVEANVITVAWNHFLKGLKEEHDGVNVGLHEMAHALYYQQVIANRGKKKMFIKELTDVMEESEEIYALKHKYKILYSEYAYKNLQEFWAESIELFFEKPHALKIVYPDLYETIKELLNQDPLNKTYPLISE